MLANTFRNQRKKEIDRDIKINRGAPKRNNIDVLFYLTFTCVFKCKSGGLYDY